MQDLGLLSSRRIISLTTADSNDTISGTKKMTNKHDQHSQDNVGCDKISGGDAISAVMPL
jgi:hypothetical protein